MKSLRTRVVGECRQSRTKVAWCCMLHRFSTWWRALSVVLLCLATMAWPAAARAGTTPSFTLQHQDAVARLSADGTSHFALTLSTSAPSASSSARVTIYPRIIDRSQLSPIIAGTGTTLRALGTTSAFALKCATHGTYKFTVHLFSRRPGSQGRGCAPAPRLHLPCPGLRCDGVYPLRIEVTTSGATSIQWSLLAVQTTAVDEPLRVDLVETMDPSSWLHAKRSTAVLRLLAHHPSSAITLSADYRTLDTVAKPGPENSLFHTSLRQAFVSPLHAAVNAPPANIDFGGLAVHGFGSEVRHQLSLSQHLLKSLTGRDVGGAVLLNGTPSLQSLRSLKRAGVKDIVIPEADLTVAPSTTLNWGAPFHVTGAEGLTALSSDGPLSTLFTDTSIGAGRRAALTLGTLDFLHFEAPDAAAPRVVVIVAPMSKTSVAFMKDIFNGFASNPFITLATLGTSFNPSLVATNGAPSARSTLYGLARTNWSSHNITTLSDLVVEVNSYAPALRSTNLGNDLMVAMEASEITGTQSARQSAINAAAGALKGQLTNFSVDPSTITLAGSGTSIPITLTNHAPYTVVAHVHLLTDQITFPKGDVVAVSLDAPTKSVRVATSGHSGSSLTLQVIVTTPNDRLVLARAAIQVRIAGTSIVGYMLTIASILVLAYWWLRTYRKRPKGRHAR
jgi:hypothetical protein